MFFNYLKKKIQNQFDYRKGEFWFWMNYRFMFSFLMPYVLKMDNYSIQNEHSIFCSLLSSYHLNKKLSN
jgi:hypothetical protein